MDKFLKRDADINALARKCSENQKKSDKPELVYHSFLI